MAIFVALQQLTRDFRQTEQVLRRKGYGALTKTTNIGLASLDKWLFGMALKLHNR
jgi:hypothetical protein